MQAVTHTRLCIQTAKVGAKSTGKSKMERSLKSVVKEEEAIREELKTMAPLKMSAEDWEVFNNTTVCWICKEGLWVENFLDSVAVRDPSMRKYCRQSHRKCCWAGTSKAYGQQPMAELQKRDKADDLIEKWQEDCLFCASSLRHKKLFHDTVKDHCHITGHFRGVAHVSCNKKLRLNVKKLAILVVFHNLQGYDTHLLMQEMSRAELYCQKHGNILFVQLWWIAVHRQFCIPERGLGGVGGKHVAGKERKNQ